MLMEIPIVLLLALAIDLTLGDPPDMFHPVAWMGRVISSLMKSGRRGSPAMQFIYGMCIVFFTIAAFTLPVYYLLDYLYGLNLIVYVIVAAVLLKTTFTLKGLRQAAYKIKNLLAADKPGEARFELRALVGRDTGKLDNRLMVSATVESIAENACDSFFAPLFYYVLLGVPGVIGYRVINTLDSMIGHHGEFEYKGKFAARLDSVVNYFPARITALLIVLAAWLCKKNASGAWRILRRDRSKTESPNAGWTMCAMAGALGVRLEKAGYYRLGDNDADLSLGKIDSSFQIVSAAAIIWSSLLVIIEVIYHVAT
jgi:adenosylcobinamide-phosphate synthase